MLSLLAGLAFADTVVLDDPSVDPQLSLDALWDTPGEHLVQLAPGVWNARLRFVGPPTADRITVEALDPTNPPVLTGQNPNGVLEATGGTVVFRNLTVVGGGGRGLRVLNANVTLDAVVISTGTATTNGGCVAVSGASSLTVDGSVFADCQANVGGAIVFSGTGVFSLANSAVVRSTANVSGGGLYVNGGRLVARNTVFAHNAAVSGSGGGVLSSVEATLVDNVFIGGFAGVNGGGWAQTGGAPYDTPAYGERNAYLGNHGVNAAGGVLVSGATTSVDEVFRDNTTDGSGAGVYAHLGSLVLSGGMFCRNDAADHGGGLLQNATTSTLVDNSIFVDNTAALTGGGLRGNLALMSHNTFVGNTAVGVGNHAAGLAAVSLADSLFVGAIGDVIGPVQVGGVIGDAGTLEFGPSACVPEAFQPVCGSAADVADLTGVRVGALDSCITADADGDGVSPPTDCDDTDAAVFPGAIELCNDGIDQDCDGADVTGFVDGDGDGVGGRIAVGACNVNTVAISGDCDDTAVDVNPTATELCNGIDDDCDGELLPAEVDSDGDGTVCSDDCEEGNPNRWLGATEVCDGVDNDCDGINDGLDRTVPLFVDSDGDGWGDLPYDVPGCPAPATSTVGGDCDDTSGAVNPASLEACGNGIDEDCDGVAEGGPSIDGLVVAYEDADGDGVGAGPMVLLCAEAEGYALVAGDCDDHDDQVSPGRLERCDGLDSDCNGLVDDVVWFTDGDGDGYGDPTTRVEQCPAPSADAVHDGTDCDDRNRWVHPDAVEICDGIDTDCTPSTPEGPMVARAVDLDGDGFGAGATVLNCLADASLVPDVSDCNDAEPADFPGAVERCDAVDNNCDDVVDDGFPQAFWLYDVDGDGFGNVQNGFSACRDLIDPFVTDLDGDCDDTEPAAFDGNPELCDGVDNDCDGETDENVGEVWYVDGDLDGYGDPDAVLIVCDGLPPVGHVENASDCDDADATINPDGSESCDGVDTDCDGDFDNATLGNTRVVFPDADADGFGDGAAPNLPSVCAGIAAPAGFSDDELDCDDSDASVNPSRTESCNGVDDDCNGLIDDDPPTGVTVFTDGDGDGYGRGPAFVVCVRGAHQTFVDGDCDDDEVLRFPGAVERCDGVDDDCDGDVDEGVQLAGAPGAAPYYIDADSDGYGDGPAVYQCFPLAGQATIDGDCDDAQSTIYPGAPEVCDGFDTDCDGEIGGAVVDWFVDGDNDSYGDGPATASCLPIAGSVTRDGDCDDLDPLVNPGAPERCNGVSDDCDVEVDEEAVDTLALFSDRDGDGAGEGVSERMCEGPFLARVGGDCDDNDPLRGPLEPEVCDGIDNDCNLIVDDNATAGFVDYWTDNDGDGFGLEWRQACVIPIDGALVGGDCNDGDPFVNPGMPERCNGFDDDCDLAVDVDLDVGNAFWPDRDGDEAGAADEEVLSCAPSLVGYVAACEGAACTPDCDDRDSSIGPAAEERCNQRDDNCDGVVDLDAVDRVESFLDLDGDGVAGSTSELVCSEPGLVLLAGPDCNDDDPTVSPTLAEVCDDEAAVDEDCNLFANAADPSCSIVVPPPPPSGCACASDNRAPLGAWVLTLGLLGLARRRAS